MNKQDLFDNILASLHEAVFDDSLWPATAALIDEACGIKGNILVSGNGRSHEDVSIFLASFCFRGQRRIDWEREYFEVYFANDERLPRLRALPHARLVPAADLYTAEERKTSVAYNEAMPRSGTQESLNVRLDGPHDSRIVWALADPITRDGWGSGQIAMIERLLPHVRQYVNVRQALADGGALGASFRVLLDATRFGIIQLDRRQRVVEANDRARGLLRRGDGLVDRGGYLHTWLPAENAALQRMLARALPPFGRRGASGSMTVRRSFGLPNLVVHVNPVESGQDDIRMRRVAALLVLVDSAARPRLDTGLVADILGLTRTESEVAVLLSEGRSVRDIAQLTNRRENAVYKLLKQAYRRRGLSRQAELVRLVLSLSELPCPRD